MGFEEVLPSAITQSGGALRRADDVREDDSGQDAVGSRSWPNAREELLELVQDRVLIAEERQVVLAGELNETSSGDPIRHVLASSDISHGIVAAVQDERWDADGREDVADVDAGDGAKVLRDLVRGHPRSEESEPPFACE